MAPQDDREVSAEPAYHEYDVVDPHVRENLRSIVSALGGPSTEDPAIYTLGDDAVSCLKDLIRWLKLYDEKLQRYDVARCLGELLVLPNDLIPILKSWKDSEIAHKGKHRIMLACVELMTSLTWPLERGGENKEMMTKNHHRHLPVLKLKLVEYKKAILKRDVLGHAVRVVLPSLAQPALERADRDEQIIKIVLYLLRNITRIEHPSPTEVDTGVEVDRSATIREFSKQNVLLLLLTIASGVGEDFHTQDVVVMEVLYHLLKGVDVEKLFMTEEDERRAKGMDLAQLLQKEDNMRRMNRQGRQPTRHNRFGTTVWVERDDGNRSFVPGQEALIGKTAPLEKLDQAKKWNKPKRPDAKGISLRGELDSICYIDGDAKAILKKFVEDFLDAGFNPLFSSLRKAIERDMDRLTETNARQFFYLVGWFLHAERARRKEAVKGRNGAALENEETESFGLVASVLNQESMILLRLKMQEWYDLKSFRELQTAMQCFTQVLYTVQDMQDSPNEEDQDSSEVIQNRLFYEESTMDLVVQILRSYTRQPLKWLDDCTEMTHVFLKLLEKYSLQQEHVFVRSKKRQTKKKQQEETDAGVVGEAQEMTNEQLAEEAKRETTERAFDFIKYESKFLCQASINTWLAFLGYYRELDAGQIMRAVKFFHRIFEKRKMDVILYRIDIVDLFNRMMRGEHALQKSHPAHKQVDQFTRYFLRKLFKKLEAQPELFVELLFTKQTKDLHFLQHGTEKETRISKPRPAAEWEVRGDMTPEEAIGVIIAALLDDNKAATVDWLKSVLNKAIPERRSWETAAEARRILAEEAGAPLEEEERAPMIFVTPDNGDRKLSLFKDGFLRLLLKKLGIERLDIEDMVDAKYIIPAHITADQLQENHALLKKFSDDPPVFDGEQTAADLLKRKAPERAPRRRDALETDSSGSSSDDFINPEFAPGGPTERASTAENKKKKKFSKMRRARDPVTDEIAEEKRRKKAERDKEKLARIKSTVLVHSSDEDMEDEEFFAREKKIREGGPRYIEPPVLEVVKRKADDDEGGRRKRRRGSAGSLSGSGSGSGSGEGLGSGDDEVMDGSAVQSEDDTPPPPPVRKTTLKSKLKARRGRRKTPSPSPSEDGDVDMDSDAPAPFARGMSSPLVLPDPEDEGADADEENEDEEEEEEVVPVRRRKRAVVVSSDEE